MINIFYTSVSDSFGNQLRNWLYKSQDKKSETLREQDPWKVVSTLDPMKRGIQHYLCNFLPHKDIWCRSCLLVHRCPLLMLIHRRHLHLQDISLGS